MSSTDVVIFNWRDWSDPLAGGAEEYVRSVATKLTLDGYVTELVTSRYPGSSSTDFEDGVRISRLGTRLTVHLRGTTRVGQLVRDNPNTIVLESLNTIPMASDFVSREYRRVVLLHHVAGRELFTEVPFPVSLGLYALERLYSRLAGKWPIVTTSDQSRHELAAMGHNLTNITVSPPGIRNPDLLSGPPTLGLTGHCIAYFGPLKRYKGVLDVLDSLPLIKREFHDADLRIAGRGYLASELKARSLRLGVQGAVSFWGYIPEAEKKRYFDGE
jgi:glycosyltransferase involved in cell wall biosynthesis